MPRYKVGDITGETWRRAYQIICNNPYNGVPSIHYKEESMISLNDNRVISDKVVDKGIDQIFTPDMGSQQFQLVNPVDDSLIPEQFADYQTLFILLYSLYFHLAKKRDQGVSPFDSWIWDDELYTWVAPIPKPDEENDYIWDEELGNWVLV